MYNEIAIFDNTKFGPVRVTMRDGEPWFVAKDVASALGYANPSRAVIQHCKKSIKSTILANRTDGTPPLNISLIPEADVYRLIMRSNLPSAEEFQDWVMEEVLPSIRRTGRYTMPGTDQQPQHLDEVKAKLDLAIHMFNSMGYTEIEKVARLNTICEALTGTPIFKLAGFDVTPALPAAIQLVNATQLGFTTGLNLSGRAVNKKLARLGYLRKNRHTGKWSLTKKGEAAGGVLTKVYYDKHGHWNKSILWPVSFVGVMLEAA